MVPSGSAAAASIARVTDGTKLAACDSATRVTATAGGGAIKVVMTGDQKCQSVEINPELLKEADAEMLQDLVLSVVNMALDQSRELASQRLGPLAGGLPF